MKRYEKEKVSSKYIQYEYRCFITIIISYNTVVVVR